MLAFPNFRQCFHFIMNFAFFGWIYRCFCSSKMTTEIKAADIKAADIKAADIIDPLNFQIPIAFKWTLKKEDLEKKIFLYKATPYQLPSLPGVFIQYSIIKDGYNGDKIMLDTEVNKGPEKRIRTNIKIRVHSANYLKWAIGESIQKGFYSANFTNQTDLLNPERKFFVDGSLTLDVTGILSVDRPNGDESCILSKLFQSVLNVSNRDDDKNADYDFSIFVKGNEIRGHKNIMASVSPVFAAMFRSKMKETIQNKTDLIGFDYKTVKFVIDLCYGKNCFDDMDLPFYAEALQMADMYEMQKAKEVIEAKMELKINCTTVVEITNLAILFNAEKLRQRCIDFILCSIYKNETLDNIDQLDKNLANEIFQQQSFYQIFETVEKQFFD